MGKPIFRVSFPTIRTVHQFKHCSGFGPRNVYCKSMVCSFPPCEGTGETSSLVPFTRGSSLLVYATSGQPTGGDKTYTEKAFVPLALKTGNKKIQLFLLTGSFAFWWALARPQAACAMQTGHFPPVVNVQNNSVSQAHSSLEKKEKLDKVFLETQRYFKQTDTHIKTFKENDEPLRHLFYEFSVPVAKKTVHKMYAEHFQKVFPPEEAQKVSLRKFSEYFNLREKAQKDSRQEEVPLGEKDRHKVLGEVHFANWYELHTLDHLAIDMFNFGNKNLTLQNLFRFYDNVREKFQTLSQRFQEKTRSQNFTSEEVQQFLSEIDEIHEELSKNLDFKQLWNFFHRKEAEVDDGPGTSHRFTARNFLMLASNFNGVVDPACFCKTMQFFPIAAACPKRFYCPEYESSKTDSTSSALSGPHECYYGDASYPEVPWDDPFPAEFNPWLYGEDSNWHDYVHQLRHNFNPFWIPNWLRFSRSLEKGGALQDLPRTKEKVLEAFIECLQEEESKNNSMAIDQNVNFKNLEFDKLLSHFYDWCLENPLPKIEGEFPPSEVLKVLNERLKLPA